MRKNRVIIISAFIIAIIISFAYGWLSHRYLLFPYPEIKYVASLLIKDENAAQLHNKIKNPNIDTTYEVELRIGMKLENLVSEKRVIETLTVPLLTKTINIGSISMFGYPSQRGPKGGLCNIGNFLVVFDGAGNGLLIDLNSMTVEGYMLPKAFDGDADFELHRINDITCEVTENDQYAYISYEMVHSKSTNPLFKFRTVIGKIKLEDFQTAKIETVWVSQLTGENEAGRLALLDDNNMLITFSDYSTSEQYSIGPHLAQDPSLLAGKIILINMATKERQLYSRGHRNPQGLFVTDTGNILATEHGPRGGDELNMIVKEGNYGWPKETHGVDYESYRWKYGEVGRHDNFDQPIFAWVPSIAVSNLLQVSNFHFSWAKDILIASLKSGSLFRTRLDNGVGVEFVEQIWLGPRIRDITETEDERIILFTDDASLIFLSPAPEFISSDKRSGTISWTDASLRPCLTCHHYGLTNPTHTAPSLTRVFSRDIASDNFQYSKALSSKTGKWTAQTLTAYLLDPQSFAQGSTMSYQVESEELARKITEILLTLDNISE